MSCWTSSARGDDGTHRACKLSGVSQGGEPESNARLAAEGIPLIPDDRQLRLGGDHDASVATHEESPDPDDPSRAGLVLWC